NLLSVVRLAAHGGRELAAWELTYLSTGFFDSRGEWTDRIEMCRIALAAAARLGDPTPTSLMGSALGMAVIRMRRFAEALEHLYPALDLALSAGNERIAGRIRNSIATAYARLRRYDEAVETYQRALAIHLRSDDRSGVAMALNNIGTVRVLQGRPELSF